LPGAGSGFMTAGFVPPSRVQPVTASAAEGPVRPVSEGGIDTWLIDRLFGRRQ
jgi:hypothetical protein